MKGKSEDDGEEKEAQMAKAQDRYDLLRKNYRNSQYRIGSKAYSNDVLEEKEEKNKEAK